MGNASRGYAPRHPQVITGLMEDRGIGITDFVYRSLEIQRPVSLSTFKRVLNGHVPASARVRGNIAATLSSVENEQVITAAQLFGGQALPTWARNSVDGVAA